MRYQSIISISISRKSLYELLHIVENVNLAPDLLEPEPVDIDLLTGKFKIRMLKVITITLTA